MGQDVLLPPPPIRDDQHSVSPRNMFSKDESILLKMGCSSITRSCSLLEQIFRSRIDASYQKKLSHQLLCWPRCIRTWKACARGKMQERYSPWSIDEKGGTSLVLVLVLKHLVAYGRIASNSFTLLHSLFLVFPVRAGMFLKTTRISLAGSIFISRKCVHTLLRNTTFRACLVVATPGIACLVRLSLSSSRLLVGTCPLAGGAYSKERFRLDCSAEYLLQVSLQACCSCLFFAPLTERILTMIRFCC
jgi:hypothetical protein